MGRPDSARSIVEFQLRFADDAAACLPHTPRMSAKQLQRQLGIGRYATARFVLQKVRRAIIAPERGVLTGEVEVDMACVGGRNSARGGGWDRLGKVAVAVEVRCAGSGRARSGTIRKCRGSRGVGADSVGWFYLRWASRSARSAALPLMAAS